MIRNFKSLGLALVAVLALSAVVASSASAVGKFTSAAGYPQTLVTEDTGEEDVFIVSGNTLTCANEQFTGELTGASSELKVTPDYVNCKTKGAAFNNVTVTDNGCYFVFTVTTTVATDHDSGNVHIKCPIGQKIEIHHYSSEHNHKVTGASSCTVTVAEQTPTEHEGTVDYITYTSLTSPANSVLIEGVVTVHAQTHGACSFGFTVNTTSEYITSTTAKAASGARIHVG